VNGGAAVRGSYRRAFNAVSLIAYRPRRVMQRIDRVTHDP
jgi:hypothetical protein